MLCCVVLILSISLKIRCIYSQVTDSNLLFCLPVDFPHVGHSRVVYFREIGSHTLPPIDGSLVEAVPTDAITKIDRLSVECNADNVLLE